MMVEIKLKDLDKIDFDSPELKKEFDEIERRNKLLMESTKVDREAMNKAFEI
jgi:hypothetical protein